ncbi:MAG: lactate utilization protein C [Actinomycetota bacterium]
MRKEDFLRRVRSGLDGVEKTQVDVPPDWRADVDDLLERFGLELAAAGGFFHRCDESGVASSLRDILAAHQRPLVLVAREDGVPAIVDEVVGEVGGRVLSWPDVTREDAAAADVGVTSALWGVAETGSVLLTSAPPGGRAPSLLPTVHVAILPASRLLGSIAELFECIASLPERPSNLVVATGPSKSGDIENELVTGVHGPKAAHVIVVTPGA